MNIKSDTIDFKVEKEDILQPYNKRTNADIFFWILTLCIGATMCWAALIHPAVTGIVAFFVFFIGLNRIDASIDWFRDINDKTPVGEKDIL